VKKVKSMGVYIVNILPLIPVEGTVFSDRRSPTPEERRELMNLCSADVRMMRHCRQCRADAIGLLDKDRSSEFIRQRPCGCERDSNEIQKSDIISVEQRIAVASKDGRNVDSGFGNAPVFRIYASDGNIHRFLKEVANSFGCNDFRWFDLDIGAQHLRGCVKRINDLTALVELGDMPAIDKAVSTTGSTTNSDRLEALRRESESKRGLCPGEGRKQIGF